MSRLCAHVVPHLPLPPLTPTSHATVRRSATHSCIRGIFVDGPPVNPWWRRIAPLPAEASTPASPSNADRSGVEALAGNPSIADRPAARRPLWPSASACAWPKIRAVPRIRCSHVPLRRAPPPGAMNRAPNGIPTVPM